MFRLGHLAACVVLLCGFARGAPVFAEETAEPPQPPAQTIPFRDDELLARGLLTRVLVATIVGIALALVAVWALRRFLNRRLPVAVDRASIALVGFRKLTPRLGVYVIEVDRTRFAVVESGDSLVQVPLPGPESDLDGA